jgi:hypothetical protein
MKRVCFAFPVIRKSNLPGSRRERKLMRSFARMAPELLRHSSDPEKAMRFAPHLRDAHRVDETADPGTSASAHVPAATDSLWDVEDLAFAGGKRGRHEELDGSDAGVADEDAEIDDDFLGDFL